LTSLEGRQPPPKRTAVPPAAAKGKAGALGALFGANRGLLILSSDVPGRLRARRRTLLSGLRPLPFMRGRSGANWGRSGAVDGASNWSGSRAVVPTRKPFDCSAAFSSTSLSEPFVVPFKKAINCLCVSMAMFVSRAAPSPHWRSPAMAQRRRGSGLQVKRAEGVGLLPLHCALKSSAFLASYSAMCPTAHRASRHTTGGVNIPPNITPIFLPSRSPEI
jgi:hypothetical protein